MRAARPGMIALGVLALAGCGGGGTGRAGTESAPSYVSEPFTAHEQLVAKGARLIVADGCSSCHLAGQAHGLGPSFTSFAGHRVTLSDGRRALVDERFIRRSLLSPRSAELRGYDPSPMLRSLRRLHLARMPAEVAALAAFIEQIGPEPG